MIDDIEILILAGGKGTRLASVINDVPKPMAPVKGKPFLHILIDSIKVQGFSNFRLLVGYKADVIQNYFGDGSKLGVQIEYTIEHLPLGTGGAIKKAIQESNFNRFLVFNGDTLFEADLNLFIDYSKKSLGLALRYTDDGARYGQVILDSQFQVKSFVEKGNGLSKGFINAGIYLFSKDIFKYFPDKDSFSIEQDVMPRLVNANILAGIPLGGKFIDIGIPEDFQRAQNFLQEFQFSNRSRALFLSLVDFAMLEKFIPILHFANSNHVLVYLVTDLKEEQCVASLKKANIHFVEILKGSLSLSLILHAQEKRSLDIKRSLAITTEETIPVLPPGLKSTLFQKNSDHEKKMKTLTDIKNFLEGT